MIIAVLFDAGLQSIGRVVVMNLLRILLAVSAASIVVCSSHCLSGQEQSPAEKSKTAATNISRDLSAFVRQHCQDCHSSEDPSGNLDLIALTKNRVGNKTAIWENVLRKLHSRQMPPPGTDRPALSDYKTAVASLEKTLDQIAAKNPDPGQSPALRRMNRTEYQNAIRDLLAVDIDAAEYLPRDESSHGFDNITVSELSPTLLNRYITAAQKISRMAVGRIGRTPGGKTYRMKADVTQEEHVPGLPLGTRGGLLIQHAFPQSGEYEINVRLARDRNEEVEGLRGEHKLDILLDRELVKQFSIRSRKDKDHSKVDAHLHARVRVTAGPHQVGVTFLKDPSSLLELKRQPYDAHYNMHRHPRITPAVFQVSINGPYSPTGSGQTPSRSKIFNTYPTTEEEEIACATSILRSLLRRAYRQNITDDDLDVPMQFFKQGRRDGNHFDAGIERALSSILVNPRFLFRIERNRKNAPADSLQPLRDIELANRLSFFLWSSLPDQQLLDLALSNKLQTSNTVTQQVNRMLADPRSQSLVTSFAAQWLYLRNLDAMTPDLRQFPDFDDNLRQAFRRETELHFERMLREDRSVLDLVKSDDTFLNERLARHYRIPHIYGSRFRAVKLAPDMQRGGLLRHGSLLTVTSYATRTSPVLRGHWILKNLIGNPPPPPPDDVPALKDNTVNSNLSVRERLAEHRANPACASCHDVMDPVGFALENFDAVGRWRETEAGRPVDASGGFPDGSRFHGVAGLERAVLAQPELFVTTLTERLMTFALGRGVEHYDGPAIRKIVRSARKDNYRFSALVHGIVNSVPFRQRRTEPETDIVRQQ